MAHRYHPFALTGLFVALLAAALLTSASGSHGTITASDTDRKPGGENARVTAPPLPMIEEAPAELQPLDRRQAMAINASRPFSSLPNPPAAPFHSRLGGEERARAVSCLAIAAIYEAGGQVDDQRAIMQVILNRVRHPAFPSGICEVVFQGSERKTGCQFTFSCDGSLQRWHPSSVAIARASELAASMLDGTVDKRVGLATHYHTDWVVPYWSGNLDKVVAIGTHLFFRWRGYWGRSASFRGRPASEERRISLLANYDPAHAAEDTEVTAPPVQLTAGQLAPDTPPTTLAAEHPPMVMQLAPGTLPGRWSLDAVAKCGQEPECRVVGWADARHAPNAMDRATLAVSPPDFVYVQVLRDRKQKAYWDCAKWAIAGSAQCLGTPGDTAELALGV